MGLVVSAAKLSLEGLDALEVSDLVAFVAEDDRPLRGLAGFADWRMCGELTRQVRAGRFAGKAGEALLTVSAGRLPCPRIFLFGLGRRAAPPPDALRHAFAAVARAGGRRVAVEPPAPAEAAATALAKAAAEAARHAGLERLWLMAEDERAFDRALAVAAEAIPGVRLAEPPAPAARAG